MEAAYGLKADDESNRSPMMQQRVRRRHRAVELRLLFHLRQFHLFLIEGLTRATSKWRFLMPPQYYSNALYLSLCQQLHPCLATNIFSPNQTGV